jgi:outer membrane lipoprotein-sorting protein
MKTIPPFLMLMIVCAVVPPAYSTEAPAPQMDGLKIMTMVAERDQGDDYTRSMAWTFFTGEKERNSMQCDEIRKNYRGKEGFNFKSVIRYSNPSKISRRSTLTWNYTDGRRNYWYFDFGFTTAKRTSDLERVRSQAEVDFNFDDYVDINPAEERHTLLKSETVQGEMCYVVESIPLQSGKKYSKRISSIDQQALIPLRIEYYGRKGKLFKVLTVAWQQVSGRWFWREAVAENVRDDKKTLIKINDVKINTGYDEREFTNVALEKIK